MKQTIIKCDCCGVVLHAANWWHDAEICNQCGEKVPIDMSRIEEKRPSTKEELMNIFSEKSEPDPVDWTLTDGLDWEGCPL